jgi:hypothetical protein
VSDNTGSQRLQGVNHRRAAPGRSPHRENDALQPDERRLTTMNGMMSGGMMWGMGLVSILVIIVLVLAAAALTKYLFFSNKK